MRRSVFIMLTAFALTILPRSSEGGQRYTLPHIVTTYQDGPDHVVVDIDYAVPRVGIAVSGGNRDRVGIEQTITVIDTVGQTVHESFTRPETLPQAGTSELRRNYVLAHQQLMLPARLFDIYVGILDLRINSTGSFYAVSAPPGQYGRFDVSDLLLATKIQAPEDRAPESRSDLTIHPNPLRLYIRGEPVFVYLELYGLTRDTFGQTGFEIAYRMERPNDDELMPELFESLSREKKLEQGESGEAYLVPPKHRSGVRADKTWDGEETETRIATRYVGDSTTDLTFLQFDISQLSEGIHKLTIEATDLATRRTVEKSTQFRVLQK